MVRPSWSAEYKFAARDVRARWRAPLGIVAALMKNALTTRRARSPRSSEPDAVLTTVKGKSLRDGLRPPLTVAPRSALRKIRSGRGDVAGQSNKEMP
jgi:hypothetical protein